MLRRRRPYDDSDDDALAARTRPLGAGEPDVAAVADETAQRRHGDSVLPSAWHDVRHEGFAT